MKTIALALLAIMFSVGLARADDKFHAVPAAAVKGKTPLTLKVVAYDGSVNGELTVEVKNHGGKPMKFAAEGLYFVPDGDPDQAPQRLGAVGPLRLAGSDATSDRKPTIEIAAGASVQVTLDVFCIDSHRPAPSSSNTFTIGHSRLPKQLAQTIEVNAKRAVDAAGVSADPAAPAPAAAAKSAIQGEVWKARDAKWIRIDGEGVQEAGK